MPNVSGRAGRDGARLTHSSNTGLIFGKFQKTTTVPHRLARPVSPGREP